LKFFNLRSELYVKLADEFVAHKIAIPPDEDLAWELAAIKKEYVGKDNTIIKVQSKKKLKEDLNGQSPDRADSLMLANAPHRFGRWDDFETTKPDPVEDAESTTPSESHLGDFGSEARDSLFSGRTQY
jgi:hypothetical protein